MAWKKVLLFGLFGAVGCLAGWLVGEPYLALANVLAPADAGRAPSLITKPVPPTTEPPAPPDEFKKRLSEAKPGGAGTGDVQISLIWNDENDLDLHCFDPYGFEICWKPGQKIAPRSHGELDVDRNAQCIVVPDPVENIYWAKGTAPQGKYSVYLDFYQRCGRGPDESKYRINVLHSTERKEFSGTIRKEGLSAGSGAMKLIYEFQLRPQIEVYAPAEFEIIPGNTVPLKVPVAVRREFYQGKVDVKVEGLPANVTAEPLTLQPTQSEGDLILKAAETAVPGKAKIKFVATGDDVNHSKDVDLTVAKPTAPFSLWTTISIGLWTALLAVGLCLALVVGQNKYLGKPPFASGRVLALVIIGAALAGFASGSIGQALFFVFFAIGVKWLGMVLGWMLLGVLLGAGVSFFVPNLDAKKAALAGLGGGLLGVIAFLIMSESKEWVGRFGGAALLGFCIGLMVAIVETAFRRAWLEVRFSEREVITVNLGPEPVKVGGDSRACTVWARGAASIALRYWIRDGKVYCEDVPTKREMTVPDGDARSAGNVTVVVRTASSAAAPQAAPRPSAPIPPAKPQAVEAKPALPAPPMPPPAPAKPQAAPAKAKDDYDDGMPVPIGPPPARPAAKSILDDDYPGPPKPVAKPQATEAKATEAKPVPSKPSAPPASVKPQATEPKAALPAAPKPPAPAAPKPPTPAAPASAASAPKAGNPDACPGCGRVVAGKPGTRYCMVCDRTF